MKRFKRETAKPGTWHILAKASQRMRLNPTPEEDLLWQKLRGSKLGLRFRRQHAIDRFVVDFVCLRSLLIVEVDGSVHQTRAGEDANRDRILESLGYQVLGFSNTQVREDLTGVIRHILSALQPSGTELQAD